MSSQKFVDSDTNAEEDQAGMAPRKCTDFPCTALFLAYVGGMIYLFFLATEPKDVGGLGGNIRRLTHGFDYKGDLCGVDTDPATGQPLGEHLFWCAGPNPTPSQFAFNFQYPICVTECPGASAANAAAGEQEAANLRFPCPQPSAVKNEFVADTGAGAVAGAGTMTETIVQEIEPEPGYYTRAYGPYCVPENVEMLAKLMAEGPMSGAFNQLMAAFGSIWRGRTVLSVVAVLSVILGYAYLVFMKIFAKPLVYLCGIGLTISTLGCGVYFLVTAGVEDMTGHPHMQLIEGYMGDNAELTAQIIGGICLLLGVFTGLTFCCFRDRIDTAVACVQEACNVMFAMPSLLLQPAIESLIKLIITGVLIYGFAWLMSCGDIEQETANIGGVEVAGVHRSFSFTKDQLYMMLAYIFGSFWVLEFFTALGQFVVSYSVCLYYFCPKDEDGNKDAPWFPLWKGYVVGTTFHLGSLAFGAALIAAVRLVRAVLLYIAKQAQADGNAALACIAKCLVCCVSCFQKCLEFLNKNAYMDIALRSSWFCFAAKKALSVIMSEAPLMAILNGACWVFQLVGFGVITGIGGYGTYTMLENNEAFNDPSSQYFIDNNMAVTLAAGAIAAGIAIPFMIVFDQCADTLLYCFVVDKHRLSRGVPGTDPCPDGLKQLVATAQ